VRLPGRTIGARVARADLIEQLEDVKATPS
jgi:hypothetical protein